MTRAISPYSLLVFATGYVRVAAWEGTDGPGFEAIAAREGLYRTVRRVALPGDAFVAFATTCTSPEGALAFANRYGLLGYATDMDHVQDGDDIRWGEAAEPVQVWFKEAAALRWLWEYWQALRTPRAKELEARTRLLLLSGEMLTEPPLGVPAYGPSAPVTSTANTSGTPASVRAGQDIADVNAQWRDACEAPDNKSKRQHLRRLGWTLLGLQVTAWLRAHSVVPDLTPVSLPRVHRDRSSAGFPMALQFSSPTLAGTLWLQLAIAISRKVEYRQCRSCGIFMTIHADGFRSNRLTCSDACRTKASRSRRKKGVTSKRKRPHSAHATST